MGYLFQPSSNLILKSTIKRLALVELALSIKMVLQSKISKISFNHSHSARNGLFIGIGDSLYLGGIICSLLTTPRNLATTRTATFVSPRAPTFVSQILWSYIRLMWFPSFYICLNFIESEQILDQDIISVSLVTSLILWTRDMHQLFIGGFEYILEPPPPWSNVAPCISTQDGYSHCYTIEKHKSGHARPRRAGSVVRHRTSPSFFSFLWSYFCTKASLDQPLVNLGKPQIGEPIVMGQPLMMGKPQLGEPLLNRRHNLSEPQQDTIDEIQGIGVSLVSLTMNQSLGLIQNHYHHQNHQLSLRYHLSNHHHCILNVYGVFLSIILFSHVI